MTAAIGTNERSSFASSNSAGTFGPRPTSSQWLNYFSDQFKFVTLSDDFSTGSSIMPQKKNPDSAELIRGKMGRLSGNFFSLLTTIKGLPLTYSKDLQEDKESFFDTADTLISTLRILAPMIEDLEFDTTRMLDAAEKGNMLATDLADYLVSRGLPFREAHGIVNKLTDYALETKQNIHELSLETYKNFSKLFEIDVTRITVENSINSRNVFGGTALKNIKASIKKANGDLEEHMEIGIND